MIFSEELFEQKICKVICLISKANVFLSRNKDRLILSSFGKISSRKQKLIRREIQKKLRQRQKNHLVFMDEISPLIKGYKLKNIFARLFLQ